MRLLAKLPRKPSRRSGLTLLEVVLSSAFLAVVLIGSTAAFSTSLGSAEEAKRITRSTLFLETVMEDVAAQPYANLLALNGNRILDGNDLDSSSFTVDLTVFQTGPRTLQVVAVLSDAQNGDELGRVASLRVQR